MLGLAGGSGLMAGRAARCSRPLRLLALLEAGIAVFALLLPWGVHLTTPLIDAAAGHLSSPQWHALLALAALLLLTLPAAAMGAGFPLLVEGWKRYGRTDRHGLWQQHTRGRSGRTVAAAAAARHRLEPVDTHGCPARFDRCRGPVRAGSAEGGAAAQAREPGERTEALGGAAAQLRPDRRREPAAGNGVAAAVQPGDAAHGICAGADPRGDVVRHGARQPARLPTRGPATDGRAALVCVRMRHRRPVAAARGLGLDGAGRLSIRWVRPCWARDCCCRR